MSSQSIRKIYTEMTSSERSELVNAFYAMRNAPDLISDLANFHSDNFNFDNTSDPTRRDIHFNLPDEPERQIFFPWHRRQIFELEQAMQEINPKISIPWWDSSIDQSPNSELWSQSFMGQFNGAWNLSRNLGVNGTLPSPTLVANTQAESDFLIYANTVERSAVHAGAHNWTGGAMSTPLSPRDPVFYLHHTYIDKLWADWENQHLGGSSHMATSMLRYDGTYVFNNQTLPIVDPDSITNPKDLGVFYAQNQVADLFNYTVNNTYHSLESFYYQYTINVGPNFLIPAGRSCNIESVNEIILLPGFLASSSSSFIARIDTDNDITTNLSRQIANTDKNYNPFEYNPEILNVTAYSPTEIVPEKFNIKTYPNPFSTNLKIESTSKLQHININIVDIQGVSLYSENFEDNNKFQINNLQNLPSGMYFLEIVNRGTVIYRKKIIKNKL